MNKYILRIPLFLRLVLMAILGVISIRLAVSVIGLIILLGLSIFAHTSSAEEGVGLMVLALYISVPLLVLLALVILGYEGKYLVPELKGWRNVCASVGVSLVLILVLTAGKTYFDDFRLYCTSERIGSRTPLQCFGQQMKNNFWWFAAG